MSFPSRIQGTGQSGLSAQTIAGDVDNGVTAAGTTAANATQVNAAFVRVSTTASGTGVKLPKVEVGAWMVVRNDGGNALTVYPQTGTTINGTADDTIAAGKANLFFGSSATTWVTLDGA